MFTYITIPLPTGKIIKIPEDNMTWDDDLKWLRSFEPKRDIGDGYKVAQKYRTANGYMVNYKPPTQKMIEGRKPFQQDYERKRKIEQLKNNKPFISDNGLINPEKLNLTK